MCYAIQNDWFREAVAVRWKEVYDDLKTLPEFVISEAEKNATSYERNFTKWNSLGKRYSPNPTRSLIFLRTRLMLNILLTGSMNVSNGLTTTLPLPIEAQGNTSMRTKSQLIRIMP